MSVERVTERRIQQRPSLIHAVCIVTFSVILSGSLYQFTRPTLEPYLSNVNRPIYELPSSYILISRACEILGFAYAGYTSTTDIVLLSILSRTTYFALLHISFDVPGLILLMTLFIDTFSLWIPLHLFSEPVGEGTVNRLEIKKEWSLSLVLTLIASSVMSIALYVAQKTILPAFLLGHFDGIQNIQASPLPLLILGFLPAGYSLQELIYKHGFHAGSIAVLVSSFLIGSSKIGLGVRGGDLLGVFGVTQFGNAVSAFAAIVIGIILKV